MLKTGRVLVVDFSPISQPELYDPRTGTFSLTASSWVGREYGTATLLNSGKVLIAGGFTNGYPNMPRSAQLYDPSSGRLVPTGSMKTGRQCFTATLLQDGRVLVAGGDVGGCEAIDNAFSSAEIYDPASGKFTPTGSMTTPRASATATLLANGEVLIVGGTDGNTDLASAELYDPETGTFKPTGSMSEVRTERMATLLRNGRVLVVGGGDSSAEVYDPSTGKFSLTGSMSADRSECVAVRLSDGRVLIVGGEAYSPTGSTAELYWP